MSAGALLPALGFLLGSLPISLWVGRRWAARDLRAVGSGNVGATNVLRVAGRGPALLAFAGDAAKGAAPVLLGRALGVDEGQAAVAVLGAVLGHMFSPWIGFRGGKGVATAFGGFLPLAPAVTVCALMVFVALVYRFRYVSLGSICAVVSFPLLWLLIARFGGPPPAGEVGLSVAAAIGFLVVWRHADNIRRLRGGREARLGGPIVESPPEARP